MHYLCCSLCVIFVNHIIISCVPICFTIMLLAVIFTEFRSNGNWECSVPVHPGLVLNKSQPDYHHVEKQHLHKTGT